MKPLDIRKVGEKEILVIWENKERSLFANTYLQLSCRCAKCVDEWNGEQIIRESDIQPDVRIVDIKNVGNYAVKFHFSSGCQNGIFSYDYLYKIDPARKAGKPA